MNTHSEQQDEDWGALVEVAPMNFQKRLPALLLLDTSASMSGPKIQELNAGLKILEREFDFETGDPTVLRSVELALITFGSSGVQIVDLRNGHFPISPSNAFVEAALFRAPTLTTGGNTPLGQAMDLALDTLAERKRWYKENRIPYNRPWIFLISDGAPDPGWEAAAARAARETADSRVIIWSIGVDNADLAVLSRFSDPRPALPLQGLRFRELFEFISSSVSGASSTTPDTPTYEITVEDLGKWAQIPLS